MKPFTAPISDRSRELYGTYMRRYESIPSMRPFNADISDRRRELFGEYMRRYETEPSMQPFDADIGDRSRHLYGEYRSRYSAQKIGRLANTENTLANGITWVEMGWLLASFPLLLNIFDKSVYQYYGSTSGGAGWTGTPQIKIEIDGVKVYPFEPHVPITPLDKWISLGFLSVNVRTGSEIKVWFKSDNAADNAGQRLFAWLGYATFE
jgi:hypothetical protein